jgi:hypothetical protein
MIVIISDEQTLMEFPEGLSLQVEDIDVYTANGFYYEVYTLDCFDIDSELFIVKKCVSETEFDVFVCFKPVDIEFGDREQFSFLFNDDESYKELLVNDSGITFDGKIVGVDCEVDIMVSKDYPGKITEYQGPDEEDNPFIFAFEAMNEDSGESFITYLSGCRVNEKEVGFL